METKKTKAAVIGAGPAGLCAAISCSRTLGRGSTVILEKQAKAGRKLLATGNGRCNISNEDIALRHYHGDRAIAGAVLGEFPGGAMYGFMRELGVLLRSDGEGRIYPYSNQASTVLDALTGECARQSVRILTGYEINTVKKENGRFIVSSGDTEVQSEYLIFASGSAAASHLGADSSGYSLLEGLGIKHTPLFPVLCPVETEESRKALKGVRAKGTVSLIADGKKLNERSGEIQFTGSGLSGICVFELSRDISEFAAFGTIEDRYIKKIKLSLDLMKEHSFPEVCAFLEERKRLLADRPASELLCGALNRQLSEEIARRCGLLSRLCAQLAKPDIKALAGTVKGMSFTPASTGGLASAQVCAGGVGADEIDPCTLRSKRVNNLYICGELLNVDGDCGGFNLHFAAGSGLLAGKLK